jgi:hypothetical protein
LPESEKEPSLFSMERNEPLRTEEINLLEKIIEKENILTATFKVHSNKGAAGIDKITVNELGEYMTSN